MKLDHIAIIMDGNRRWASANNLPSYEGHKKGAENLWNIIKSIQEFKLKFLTVFVFSTENWKRPAKEVNYLFKLLNNYIEKKIKKLLKKNIKIKVIGNIKPFPSDLKYKIKNVEKKTKNNSNIQINMALNYGSRQELIFAIKKIKKNKLAINEKNINNNLYTKNIPDPDILIRTGNTNRISNFMIWQSIYSEIFFIKKMWPDFNKRDLKKIILNFKKIHRNFGGIIERTN